MNSKEYTDVAYVDGVYRRNPVMERALYDHCKQYFDENYRGVFFVGEEHKMEIFQEAFIKLWENIEKRKIHVEDGMLKGKEGMPFTGKLTTYFMGIAKNKYREWVRDQQKGINVNVDDKTLKKRNQEQYKEFLYDETENEIVELIAECISRMSERCNQILTMFYYERKTLDDIMIELPTFESKDALKTAKYKCMENLRKSAGEMRNRYMNS